jgi:hypothetical protein
VVDNYNGPPVSGVSDTNDHARESGV